MHYRTIAEKTISNPDIFYPAVLSAGAILTGFSGTFLQFRIQREASYYRQPVLLYVEGAQEGQAQDVPIGRTHFTGAFFLIIVSTLMAVTFGFVCPLLVMAHLAPPFVTQMFITAGLLSTLFPLFSYFLTELIHYRILSKSPAARHRRIQTRVAGCAHWNWRRGGLLVLGSSVAGRPGLH